MLPSSLAITGPSGLQNLQYNISDVSSDDDDELECIENVICLMNREDAGELHTPTLWKSYLYQLQQQAPQPQRIVCNRHITNRPPYYGREFHGTISREAADKLLSEGDGCYLVRESQRAPGAYTLSMRFGGVTKNFKLFYDGKHYVGEKRFDTIQDLVADGLITLYMESKASDYIAVMSNDSNYEHSPYFTLNSQKRKRHIVLDDMSKSIESPLSPQHTYETPHPDSVQGLVEALQNNCISLDVKQYEKTHCFKVHNFKGLQWCDFCGNFMWGLIAQGVKCEDCGFSAHKKCSEKVPNDCMPDLKYVKRIFGVDLTTLVKAHNIPRPTVVDMCIKEIESRGVTSEGLYRLSGFTDEVEALRLTFDQDGESTNISKHAYEDINVITGVLKLYFRLLPIPLITFDTYHKFIEAAKCNTLDERLQGLCEATAQLPPAHYQTLKYLISHLNRVAHKSKENLMTPENLSVVFGPTLLRSPETDGFPNLTSYKMENQVIEILITHHKPLFEK